MPRSLQRCLLIAAVLLCGIDCPAQTNVYSLSVHTKWAVGSYPFRFGLEGYRKSAAGYDVVAADARPVAGPTGGKNTDYTAVIIGPAAFSVALPPVPVALSCVGIFLALCLGLVAIFRRSAARNMNDHRASNKRGAGQGGFAVLRRAGRASPALPDRERWATNHVTS